MENEILSESVIDVVYDDREKKSWPLWKRMLISSLWIALAGGLAWSCWIFGMLMFMFSLDGANPSDIPPWVEPFMLVGWGGILIAAVSLPCLLYLFGVGVKKCGILLACLVGLGVLSPLVAWVTTMIAITK